MVRAEPKIVVAAIAVFVTLGGLASAIHGLLFDQSAAIRYGLVAMVIGIACFVLMLNPSARDDR